MAYTSHEIARAQAWRQQAAAWTPKGKNLPPKTAALITDSLRSWAARSDEEIAQMLRQQMASYIHAMMATCEHGASDFEQCGACREVALANPHRPSPQAEGRQ